MARMTRRATIGLALLFVCVGAGHPVTAMTSTDPRQVLSAMGKAVTEIRDYTMTIISQEWEGDGLAPAETIIAKWARPFKIYYKRLTAPHVGREVLFADGWNDGKLKVSVHAWPFNVGINLNPHGDLAMAEAKHPVDESSLVYLVTVVLDNLRRAEERGEARIEDHGEDPMLGRPCHHVRILSSQAVTSHTLSGGETLWDVEKKFNIPMAPLLHENRKLAWEKPSDAKPGQTIRVPRYYAARIDLWIDDEIALPLLAEIYDEHGSMFERFEHRDLRVNVGLGPKDFSPTNPEYKF